MSRLLIRLLPKEDFQYDLDYHYHVQGLIYSLARKAGRIDIHDKSGYKFFCFSNIFPYRPKLERGEEHFLLISSPDHELMRSLREAMENETKTNSAVRIGSNMEFLVSGIEGPFSLKIPIHSPASVLSATPIIMRIPKWRYADYGIVSSRPFENWKETLAFEAFVKQLYDNFEKKWKNFTAERKKDVSLENQRGDLLQNIRFPEVISYKYLKTVSKPITIRGERQQVVGSIWEIEFAVQDREEAEMLKFALDCGFGERNSLGFGFVNLSHRFAVQSHQVEP
jgi:CRISPR-associated endoribonuclease Cas6